MLGLRRALLALFALGVIFAGLDVALALTSSHEDQKVVTALLGPLIGLSFIGTGVFAWWRRPLNRFGLLMTGVGIAWFLAGLTESNNSTVYTIGSYVEPLYLVIVIQMVLSFPTGRLETFAQRVTIAAGYLVVLAVRLPFFLLGGDISGDLKGPRPDNVFAIVDAPDLADVFDYTATFIAVVVLVATLVLLVRKRQAATPPQRRALAPMLWTGLALVGLLGIAFIIDVLGLPGRIGDVAGLLALISFAVLPFAFLAGLVRSRYSRAGAVGELIERLNNPEADRSLGLALADALGDRSLKLVYWRPSAGHYVTYDGRPVELPEAGSGRAVTEVEREGIRVGAIIHDASLADEPGLVRAVAASAALALENERLEAELRARLDELQTSRSRLVEVSMFERRRLERDLHDGAQQRLVALSLQLGLAKRRLEEGEDGAAGAMLDAARDELARALEELRELARGIHPAVLTDRGLEPALEALAERAPLPVSLDQMPAERLPAPVEAAAYFVVAEALTNVVKYAEASTAAVRIRRNGSYAVVEVHDDGIGGADPTVGTGLRGLADRLAALDGRLEVHSPPGEGTTVRAEVPCA
ncbi:MAG TPA: sensor histidine kinase [Solirubrobacteraceae bacterium]|nr:sensor histidine kinase [Solirubrobacteraceae bacterium]